MAIVGVFLGILAYVAVRLGFGCYTVQPNEVAVLTTFGRAERLGGASFGSEDFLRVEGAEGQEEVKYAYPRLVVHTSGLHFKWPWQEVRIVPLAIQTVDIGFDPSANSAFSPVGRRMAPQSDGLGAITKDQLNIKISGQLRYKVSPEHIYAYCFGIKNPIAHVMGFFHSVLREKIANYQAPRRLSGNTEPDNGVGDVSINDLRKNLQDINQHMEEECRESAQRYGISLEAALITNIDPPSEVESALASINTAHNQVSSDLSVAQATADQTLVQSKRAVEIQTLKAQAEVEPLRQLSQRLRELRDGGGLYSYLRNLKLGLLDKAKTIVMEDARR